MSDHLTRAVPTQASTPALPWVQYGEAESADFEMGTWTFSMLGDWRVAAGDFAILPTTHYAALAASHTRLLEALKRIDKRCPRYSADYRIASVGDAARAAIAAAKELK